jgi:hypothetical protein
LKTLISALFTLFLLVLIVAMAIHIYTIALQIQEDVNANVLGRTAIKVYGSDWIWVYGGRVFCAHNAGEVQKMIDGGQG